MESSESTVIGRCREENDSWAWYTKSAPGSIAGRSASCLTQESLTGLVLSLSTWVTVGLSTRHTSLNSNSIPDFVVLDPLSNFNNLSGRLVAGSTFIRDNHSGSDLTMFPEMHIRSMTRVSFHSMYACPGYAIIAHPQIPVALTWIMHSPARAFGTGLLTMLTSCAGL